MHKNVLPMQGLTAGRDILKCYSMGPSNGSLDMAARGDGPERPGHGLRQHSQAPGGRPSPAWPHVPGSGARAAPDYTRVLSHDFLSETGGDSCNLSVTVSILDAPGFVVVHPQPLVLSYGIFSISHLRCHHVPIQIPVASPLEPHPFFFVRAGVRSFV